MFVKKIHTKKYFTWKSHSMTEVEVMNMKGIKWLMEKVGSQACWWTGKEKEATAFYYEEKNEWVQIRKAVTEGGSQVKEAFKEFWNENHKFKIIKLCQ